MTANYSGDAGNLPSTSSALGQAITTAVTRSNVALASAGAVASASSTMQSYNVAWVIDGDLASKTIALHGRIYASSRAFDRDTACVIHTHSTHCVALTLSPHADELLRPITPYFVMKVGHVPIIAYHRPGAPETADDVARAVDRYGEAGTPIRAVMLERLGPTVWHDSPAAAMAVLEELEETARLACLVPGMAPLDDARIDELRATFGARW